VIGGTHAGPENRSRSRRELEYGLIDTGVFGENKYFDVFVEHAKADVKDILINITVCNRGPAPASSLLLPTLLFRNTWIGENPAKPSLEKLRGATPGILARHSELGTYTLFCESAHLNFSSPRMKPTRSTTPIRIGKATQKMPSISTSSIRTKPR
jgi:hypothetical protein